MELIFIVSSLLNMLNLFNILATKNKNNKEITKQ